MKSRTSVHIKILPRRFPYDFFYPKQRPKAYSAVNVNSKEINTISKYCSAPSTGPLFGLHKAPIPTINFLPEIKTSNQRHAVNLHLKSVQPNSTRLNNNQIVNLQLLLRNTLLCHKPPLSKKSPLTKRNLDIEQAQITIESTSKNKPPTNHIASKNSDKKLNSCYKLIHRRKSTMFL